MGLLSLFKIKRNVPKIIQIENSDVLLNKTVFELIGSVEKGLLNLSNLLKKKDISEINAELAELENIFIRLKMKIDSLILDIEMVTNIEVQNKDFIMLNDETYISDKKERLSLMKDALDELIELLSQHPSTNELNTDLLAFMYSKLNLLVESTTSIVNDDHNLETIYSRLTTF